MRVWVNENVTPRVYFGDFYAGKYTITDGDSAALDICGAFDSASPNNVSQVLKGYYDVLNFVWYQGAQNLFQGSSSSNNQMVFESIGFYFDIIGSNNYLLRGFLPPDFTFFDLQCAPGYYLEDGMKCVTAPSDDSYFLHSPTNSYQRN